MRTITDLRPLHQRALAASEQVIAAVASADLGRPTPCGQWDLCELLGHMIGQNDGFATAVSTGDAPVEAFAHQPPGGTSISTTWHDSAERIAASFAGAALDRTIHLVEISNDVPFSVGTAIGFQLLDTVVHTWDVARAIGTTFRPDDELVAATWAIAQQVPDGPAREQVGASFAPRIASNTGDRWVDALALLGRSADWPR